MANAQLLGKYFDDSGKKKIHLAEKIKVSRPRLDYIFDHPETATVGQADDLCKELSIPSIDKKVIFIP